jgi:antitoxin (DNA-binding transcriptional repressor) of toxin-antitoxin stability system
MRQANIDEAMTNLSQLVEAALAGEQVVIACAGKPAVELVPYRQPGRKRKFGAMKGRLCIAEDFDAPFPEPILSSVPGKAGT